MKNRIFIVIICLILFSLVALEKSYSQQDIPIPRVTIGVDNAEDRGDVATTLEILFLLTIITLAPAIAMLMTSFTRMVIVLSFVRQALGIQQIPANQIIIGLSLFMTFFLMKPVGVQINQQAIQPYLAEEIDHREALNRGVEPIKEFMFLQTRKNDLAFFYNLAYDEPAYDKSDIDVLTLIPAFVISELKTAFEIAFMIYIPFLIIDIIVASTLMSMGMLLLPPILISLPFKILLFIAVDGWHLVVVNLIRSFEVL